MPETQEQGNRALQESLARSAPDPLGSAMVPSSLPPSLPPSNAPGPLAPLDVTPLRKPTLGAKIAGFFVTLIFSHPVLRVFRWFRVWRFPIANLALVTRYREVEEVLTRDRTFAVVGERVQALNEGSNFLLGLQDGKEYQRYQKLVMRAFALDDIEKRVIPLAAAHARSVIARSEGRLDAISDLVTGVPVEIVQRYYGVPVPDAKEFATWTFAISVWLFNPAEARRYEPIAKQAAVRLNSLVDAAIDAAKHAPPSTDTIVQRLLRVRDPETGAVLDARTIRVIVVGMIVGFVPTNTMAGGHMLDILLERADFMQQARRAALSNDDERLKRCLFEAMRFKPLLREPLRVCLADYPLAEGTRFATTIRAGTRVIAVTKSAMFDPGVVERPREFDPDRPAHHRMLFGFGLHRCIGALLAEAQITHTFKPLLLLEPLRRAPGPEGKLKRLGPFPERLVVEIDRSGAAAGGPRGGTAAS